MLINQLTRLFNDKMTLNEVSKELNQPINDIINLGTDWGYDFEEWSERNIKMRLNNLTKEELINIIIKSNIL